MFARVQNARFGRWENLWAAEEVCVTELLGRGTIIEKVVYAAANPVKDLLVEQARQWPGVNGYTNLVNGTALHATRPRHFFRADGTMPEEVTLTLTIPPELGRPEAFIAEIRSGVEAVEKEMRELRSRTGKRILGRKAILQQSWRDSPKTEKPRRGLRPRFAGPVDVRVPALLAFRAFLAAYREAREELRAGHEALFPAGTYWLARHVAVRVATSPSI
jgi:hypothetical protein